MATTPFKVKAVYDYSSPHADDLSFPNGQMITVIEEEDADWYVGQYTDSSGAKHEGLFPKNFVERVEPEAPPRPTRTRTKRESLTSAPAAADIRENAQEPPVATSQAHFAPPPAPLPIYVEPTAASAVRQTAVEPVDAPLVRQAPEPKPAAAAKPPPPAVAEKPSSFKDRIAAFNKSSQAPLAPVKPSGPPAAFVKKAFVAPPPARDSYVPPPREVVPPHTVYRREEDPEIAEQQAQDQENAERAGLIVSEATEGADDTPKTSLKERIALLQKQQQDQASRRTELTSKEKPKRPVKKRTGSSETTNTVLSNEGEDHESAGASGVAQRASTDLSRNSPRLHPMRRLSRDPRSPDLPTREGFSDENDADISGAGETEEPESMNTEIEEHGERIMTHPHPLSRQSTLSSQQMPQTVVEDEGETEEEDEIDVETRRRMELRERMAKMSGGMGMPGMFGGGMPMPPSAPKKQPPTVIGGDRAAPETGASSTYSPQTQRMSMMPMPGMFVSPESRVEARPSAEKEREPIRPLTADRDLEVVQDIEGSRPTPSVMAVPPPMQGKFNLVKQDNEVGNAHMETFNPRSNDPKARWSYVIYDHEQEKLLKVDVFKRSAPPVPATAPRPMPPLPNAPRPMPAPPMVMEGPLPQQMQARAVPPLPVPQELRSSDLGLESDDVLSNRQEPVMQGPMPPPHRDMPIAMAGPPPPHRELPLRAAPPPIPITTAAPMRSDGPRSPVSPSGARMSYFSNGPTSPIPSSPPAVLERRVSRGPPPIPLGSPRMLPHSDVTRLPPPPPPPTAVPQMRQPPPQEAAVDHGESEYEGDYDTDPAPIESHRDAFKTQGRDEPSYLDESFGRLPVQVFQGPPSLPPPIPSTTSRGAPPPPPHQGPHSGMRQSIDIPRAPPPAPPPRDLSTEQHDDYDPYSYNGKVHGVPLTPTAAASLSPDRVIQESESIVYSSPTAPRMTDRAPPPPPSHDRVFPPPPPTTMAPSQPPPQGPPQGPPPSHDRVVPQPPPASTASMQVPPQRLSRDLSHQSVDMSQAQSTMPRRSVDAPRPSGDHGPMAQDVDLGFASKWWAQPSTPPPVFQKRGDVIYEIEESTSSKRGGRTTVSKDVYVLFPDYSQTIVTVRFDAKDPADVNLEQRHEPPPRAPRQEQLENAHRRFGNAIVNAVASKQNQTFGDGNPHAMIMEALRAAPSALLPVGTRAYGALVYANMANSSVTQYDEIRPGDIITFRNAKFQGKHGAMHAKYNLDVGRPEHVGVVAEWDGTKKKVRAWEQGRESKRVKMESFKVGDLRSGEVKVWRVMGRDWVGWEGQN